MPVLHATTVLTLVLGLGAAGAGSPAAAADVIVLAQADGGRGAGVGGLGGALGGLGRGLSDGLGGLGNVGGLGRAGNEGAGRGGDRGGDPGGSPSAGNQRGADRGADRGPGADAAPTAGGPAVGIGVSNSPDRAEAGRPLRSQGARLGSQLGSHRARLDPSAGGWVCDPGHRRVGMRCEPVTVTIFSPRPDVSPAATAPAAPAPGNDVQPAYGPELIRAVQESLLALGFQPGPVDGVFGPRTRSALQAYQRAKGLPDDGRLSQLLIARILAAGLLADLEEVR